ncbi:MAG: cytochrome-c oxidase, cbb3-type subunit I [Deltaproteobacteria bacterium]|nr:cytochrome-c oxidase, cbb3-type subunit I [Deltaproteobacteria bacterium]
METQRIVYNDKVVRQFLWASVLFGIVGMLVGIIVALQLAYWPANLAPYLSFGRLRPLHTNALIFAFVGNMLFSGIYYSTQRLVKARLASDLLSATHFWGWQLIIVAAAVTLPLGISTAKEYAELEWPIDIAIAVIWVVFAINFFWTLGKRREKHLYVAIWFYIATIITIAVLHIVNSFELPVSAWKSYSVFAGVQDAMVQWWYGHNAVAFFLTTPILGIMYYFLPKAADRPVFSYRLSIVHFWGLVFLYIWAGPHHLLYTALPDWAQSLGMVFSLMLWAPSWGGMLNGLLTLRGAWDKLRTDPVLKFLAAGVTFYGMSTFEGPLLSIKAVSGLAHYTDWIIAHVHGGTLGWNGLMAAGMFYWLVPRLYGTKLHSRGAANFHFWIATVGILLYVISMWVAGITQGLMWRAMNETGGLLYPNFVETLIAIRPMYWARLVGGSLYFIGFIIMTWNLIKTAQAGSAVDGEIEVPVLTEPRDKTVPWPKLVFGQPIMASVIVMALLFAMVLFDGLMSTVLALAAVMWIVAAIAISIRDRNSEKIPWHRAIEGRAGVFTVIVTLAILVGGIIEIIPLVISVPETIRTTKNVPYTPLELEGRDVYVREGCYTCHSQMIRPFTWETARYGEVSTLDDSIFDHPFQWGSRRIGPDLARVGGKYADVWHYKHMTDPREISPGSNMPPYDHLSQEALDFSKTANKLRVMRNVGVGRPLQA